MDDMMELVNVQRIALERGNSLISYGAEIVKLRDALLKIQATSNEPGTIAIARAALFTVLA